MKDDVDEAGSDVEAAKARKQGDGIRKREEEGAIVQKSSSSHPTWTPCARTSYSSSPNGASSSSTPAALCASASWRGTTGGGREKATEEEVRSASSSSGGMLSKSGRSAESAVKKGEKGEKGLDERLKRERSFHGRAAEDEDWEVLHAQEALEHQGQVRLVRCFPSTRTSISSPSARMKGRSMRGTNAFLPDSAPCSLGRSVPPGRAAPLGMLDRTRGPRRDSSLLVPRPRSLPRGTRRGRQRRRARPK